MPCFLSSPVNGSTSKTPKWITEPDSCPPVIAGSLRRQYNLACEDVLSRSIISFDLASDKFRTHKRQAVHRFPSFVSTRVTGLAGKQPAPGGRHDSVSILCRSL